MGLVRNVRAIRDGVAAVLAGVTGAQEVLRRISETQAKHTTILRGLTERTRQMATQDQVNALAEQQAAAAAAIGESLNGIQGDLDDVLARLREAEANDEPIDLAPLEAVRDQLAAVAQQAANIDAQNPAPVPPVQGGPVDEAPV